MIFKKLLYCFMARAPVYIPIGSVQGLDFYISSPVLLDFSFFLLMVAMLVGVKWSCVTVFLLCFGYWNPKIMFTRALSHTSVSHAKTLSWLHSKPPRFLLEEVCTVKGLCSFTEPTRWTHCWNLSCTAVVSLVGKCSDGTAHDPNLPECDLE
jgi:hypothetical protein